MASRPWRLMRRLWIGGGVAAAVLLSILSTADQLIPRQRVVSFEFKQKTLTLSLTLPAAEFEKYGDLPHSSLFPLSYQMALTRHDPVVKRVAAAARFLAERNGWSERDLAQLLLFIAQYVPYISDSEHVRGDYVRYPGETFFMTGDCEDKSLLAHALLAAAGFKSVLVTVHSEDSGHAFVGLEVDESREDVVVVESGQRFVLTEVSAPRWQLGQISDDFKNADLVLHRAAPNPRSSVPRGFEELFSHNDLVRRELEPHIDPNNPKVLRIETPDRRVAIEYPAADIAREALHFFQSWQEDLSPFFKDSQTLMSVRYRQEQVRLQWE